MNMKWQSYLPVLAIVVHAAGTSVLAVAFSDIGRHPTMPPAQKADGRPISEEEMQRRIAEAQRQIEAGEVPREDSTLQDAIFLLSIAWSAAGALLGWWIVSRTRQLPVLALCAILLLSATSLGVYSIPGITIILAGAVFGFATHFLRTRNEPSG